MKILTDLLQQFNWIDIFVVIVALRISYISFKKGLKFEFFKILGTLAALYLSLHYFTALSAFFNQRVLNRQAPSSFFNSLSFFLLAAAGYGLFFGVRWLLGKVINTEVDSRLDRWGGFTLGVCRAALTISIVLCLFLTTAKDYFKKSVHSSFSGVYLARIAPETYIFFWDSLASKLHKQEKVNPAISALTKHQ